MNEMHGLEVLQRIRSRVETAALPVIVATGSNDP
jgi:CheY-like chemotaxis protein|tara:strand:- start:52 stop:153 length:102 start_codon:yes stop_codon:yes gene_type:complete